MKLSFFLISTGSEFRLVAVTKYVAGQSELQRRVIHIPHITINKYKKNRFNHA